jgi:hypothetical protein
MSHFKSHHSCRLRISRSQARPIIKLQLTPDEVKKRYREAGGVPCDVYSGNDKNRVMSQNTGMDLTDREALKLVSGKIDVVETGNLID